MKKQKTQKKKKIQGFSLITAVFLIVILALIASFIVGLSSLTNLSGNYAIQGVRANYAARSGLEWGANQMLEQGSPSCSATPTTLSFGTGLNSFSADVTCTTYSFTAGINTYNVYTISATGRYGTVGNNDYVARTMRVRVFNLP